MTDILIAFPTESSEESNDANSTYFMKIDLENSTLLQGMKPSPVAVYTASIVMLLSFILGLGGNFIVLFVILCRRDMKNIINIFIASLCINDILNVGFNNSMVIVSYFLMHWPTGILVCELAMHFTVLLMGSSLWHTGLIAVHRLIVVVFNPFYKNISKKAYTVFVLVFARAVPALFLIHPNLGNMVYYEPRLLRCIVKKEFGLFKTLVSIVLMIIPSVILIVCYIAIFAKVHHSSSMMRAGRKSEWLRREVQITKMFGIVFLMIIVGYLPYGIVRSIDKQMSLSADCYVVITVLYAVANCVNPIIYGAMDRKIRQACFEVVCPKHIFEGNDTVTITKVNGRSQMEATENMPLQQK